MRCAGFGQLLLLRRDGVTDPNRNDIGLHLRSVRRAQIELLQGVRRGLELGVDYSLTHSCYDPTPDGVSCGRCDACRIRRAAFERLGLADPIRYST